MREFTRVTKPGGLVVSCNFDGFAVTHEPVDPAMQPLAVHVFSALVDPFIGRRLAGISRQAGLIDIQVAMEADNVFTVIGKIDAERRSNWETQLKAARERIIKHLGSVTLADAFIESFMKYQDREDTASYCTLFIVCGRKPTLSNDCDLATLRLASFALSEWLRADGRWARSSGNSNGYSSSACRAM